MDRNELLGGGSQKADFSGAICDQTSSYTGYQYVQNERYGHDLSLRYPLVYCGSSGIDITASQRHAFFSKFSKMLEIFGPIEPIFDQP